MKVFNLIWGFSLGAGIDKCYLVYDNLSSVDSTVEVHSVCINILNLESDLSELKKRGVTLINIKNKKDFSWVTKLGKEIKRTNPDVIFTHGFNGAIMMLLLKTLKGLNIPLVCSYHGKYHAPTKRKKIIEPVFNYLPILIYKHLATKVVCVEEYSKNYLLKKGVSQSKLVKVYNGIQDKTEFNPINPSDFGINKNLVTIITASRISEVKGLPYLLDAIKILKTKTNILFQYIMIGEGPDLDNLKQKSKQLEITEHIHFIGFQNNIAWWLDFADIFALPSLSECHSIAILEAMRAGKAIVATNVGGNPESIQNDKEGLLVPPKNPGALADALLKLLENEQLRKKYGEAAKLRFHQNFTENAMKRNLINALKL